MPLSRFEDHSATSTVTDTSRDKFDRLAYKQKKRRANTERERSMFYHRGPATMSTRPKMHVPNWLITLELSAGAALLYICSSAAISNDIQLSRPASETAPSVEEAADPQLENPIILSQN